MGCKENGELAEAKFIVKALEKGFIVSIPYGDSCEYDFILDYGGKLNKIQVKSTFAKYKAKDKYMTKVGHGGTKRPYKNIDFICFFVAPEDVWYVIPFEEMKAVSCCVYPHREALNSGAFYESFKEVWEMMY